MNNVVSFPVADLPQLDSRSAIRFHRIALALGSLLKFMGPELSVSQALAFLVVAGDHGKGEVTDAFVESLFESLDWGTAPDLARLAKESGDFKSTIRLFESIGPNGQRSLSEDGVYVSRSLLKLLID